MQLIGSARLTATLFVAFLVLFLIGILVPQVPLADPQQVANFAEKWPWAAAAARATDLDDVYHSAWIYVVFTLFVVQIGIYLVRRAHLLWSDPWLSTAVPAEECPEQRRLAGSDETLTDLTAMLRAHRYRIRSDEGRVVAVRNGRSPLWGLTLHASFVVMLLGAWILRATHFHGSMLVTEGQLFSGTGPEYGLPDDDPDNHRLPEVSFQLDKITPVFNELGTTTDIAVDLHLANHDAATIGVNRPITVDGADVLIKNFGVAPVFTLWQRDGSKEVPADVFASNLICWSPGLPTDAFRVEGAKATVHARFWPDYVDGPEGPASRSMTQRDPVLGLRVQIDGEPTEQPEQRLRPGEKITIGDYELRLEEHRTWGEFLVSRQSGTVLLLGFLLMVLGSGLRLFFPRRQVIAELRAGSNGDTEIAIGGRGEYFPVGFRWEFDAMLQRFTSTQRTATAKLAGDHGQD